MISGTITRETQQVWLENERPDYSVNSSDTDDCALIIAVAQWSSV